MNKKIYILLALLMVLYLLITFGTPTNETVLARYKMDATQYHLMRASLAIPLFLVWFAAFYGFSKLLDYARSIKDSPDGESFMWIASGLTILAVGMPVNSIITTIFSRAVAADMITQPASTIITTHLSVGYQLVSFLLIAIGSWKLLKVLKKVQFPKKSLIVCGSILAVISVLYTISALNNPSRAVPVAPAQTATYYMNDALIFMTIIIPYIVSWACGLFAVVAIWTYQQDIGGVLYKKALKKLNTGLLVIILLAILLQFLTAAVLAIYAWQLGPLVTLIQLIVFAVGVGFIYVALGAKGLARLESAE